MFNHRFVAIALVITSTAMSDIIYVNANTGNDAWDGRCPEWNGGTCGPKQSIWGAINAAHNNDEIIVADGRYTGPNNRDMYFGMFYGGGVRSLNLHSANGPRNCIIDCQQQGAAFHNRFWVTNLAGTIAGLTITGSTGGAVSVANDTLAVRDCWCVGNGFGIDANNDGAVLVDDTLCWGNEAGGIFMAEASPGRAQRCIVAGNSGTGLGCDHDGNSVIQNCVFIGNDSYQGAGIWLEGSAARLTNCLVAGNHAHFTNGWSLGGGVYSSFVDINAFVNCTIAANVAQTGGAVYSDASSLSLHNCVLWGNSPDEIVYDSPGRRPAASYSDIPGGWPGAGNIDANPRILGGPAGYWSADSAYDPNAFTLIFTDRYAQWSPNRWAGCTVNPNTAQPLQYYIVANTHHTLTVLADWPTVSTGVPSIGAMGQMYRLFDYRLSARSPCIDAADNTAVPDGVITDLAGQPRFHDDPNTPDTGVPGGYGGAAIVDMGAFEFQDTSDLVGDLNCDGVVDFSDINPFVLALTSRAAYEAAYPGCLWMLADCNADGRVDFDDINPFLALLRG